MPYSYDSFRNTQHRAYGTARLFPVGVVEVRYLESGVVGFLNSKIQLARIITMKLIRPDFYSK